MLLAALMLAGAQAADTPPGHRPHGHTHAPGEVDERHGPLLLQVTYTGEIMGNASGGLRRGARYIDNLDIVFESDLERLVGWTGAQLHVYGLYNNGHSISDLVGDVHAVSNIETGTRALRLYEAWIDQKIGRNVSLRTGLYDLNSEFDALDAAGLFVSSPHGIGTDVAQSGRNGPSIFPSTALAARLEVAITGGWKARAAILDGVPGDPDRPGRTVVRFGKSDGALLVGEVEASLAGGKLLLGHWRYTANFDRNDGTGVGRGNAGSYVRAELPVIDRGARRLDVFGRLGIANGRFNLFDRFAGAGLKFTGWIPGREQDEFGLALAAGFTADSYRSATGAGRSEVAIEATYRAPVTPWLTLQPNVHYVRRPAADPAIADAIVLGIRAETSLSLLGF